MVLAICRNFKKHICIAIITVQFLEDLVAKKSIIKIYHDFAVTLIWYISDFILLYDLRWGHLNI